MLMAKYADLVIGAESGLMVAANLFGSPTIQLMTAASIKNHGGDLPNDHSLQSPAKCSPCHKGPYDYIGCPTFEHLGLSYPKCVLFNPDTVLDRMEEVYRQRKYVARPWAEKVAGI
jgi:ADP-heptose:LPS heptosyltransferase